MPISMTSSVQSAVESSLRAGEDASSLTPAANTDCAARYDRGDRREGTQVSRNGSIELIPVAGLGDIRAGDDLAVLVREAASGSGHPIEPGDVIVIAQKIVSKAEGRLVQLTDVRPGARALELASICGKDPRLVELVLRESQAIVRCVPGVLIARHRLGFTVANAAIDQSNVAGDVEHALLLPEDPDRSAHAISVSLSRQTGAEVGVIVNDSFGRPWRRGTCGVAIGCAGVEALVDLRGRPDRFGRRLETTEVAYADEIAAAASLVMGQADEGIPAVIVRGLARSRRSSPASELIRPESEDLFK
jgi:coenzyme F420-0:L-glutamate ligase/coenzyme F420-1:gamma-L-glutamate ligase